MVAIDQEAREHIILITGLLITSVVRHSSKKNFFGLVHRSCYGKLGGLSGGTFGLSDVPSGT